MSALPVPDCEFGPKVISRMRARFTRLECEPDGIGRWMATSSNDREFCRWVSKLGLDLTDDELLVIAAVVEVSTPEAFVLLNRDEYELLHAAAAVERLSAGTPHVRAWGHQ